MKNIAFNKDEVLLRELKIQCFVYTKGKKNYAVRFMKDGKIKTNWFKLTEFEPIVKLMITIESLDLPSFDIEHYWSVFLFELNKNAQIIKNMNDMKRKEEIYRLSASVINKDVKLQEKTLLDTELRKRYYEVKKWNTGHEHETENIIQSKGQLLACLFLKAVSTLSKFSSEDKFFPDKGRIKKIDRASHIATVKLQGYFEQESSVSLKNKNKTDRRYSFLAREISPLTIRNGVTNEGKSAKNSGFGGIDLLCLNEFGNGVIIEYKSRKDADLYCALIQAVTYCSEIVTENQLKRLRLNYPKITKGKIEICILWDEEKKANEFEAVYKIAEIFLAGECVEKRIRDYVERITFVKYTEEKNQFVIFKELV